MTDLNSKKFEDFKKSHLKKIDEVSKQKTEWLKDFKETYQANREEKKRIYKLDRLK